MNLMEANKSESASDRTPSRSRSQESTPKGPRAPCGEQPKNPSKDAHSSTKSDKNDESIDALAENKHREENNKIDLFDDSRVSNARSQADKKIPSSGKATSSRFVHQV